MLDLSSWNANTARTGSGPFFFIYPSGVPKVVELRDYISSTKLTGKYYSISAIEVLPAPQLVIFQPLLGGQHVSLANWLFLFRMSLFPAPTLLFPCPISLSYVFAHGLPASKGNGKFCRPKPNTDYQEASGALGLSDHKTPYHPKGHLLESTKLGCIAFARHLSPG